MANEVTLTVRARDQNAKAVLEETGRSLTNVGNIAKGILAAGFIQDIGRQAQQFLGQAGRAASGLEQALGGTRAVFGDASKAIDQFARTSDQSAGLSERAFREATTLIGGQLKRMTGDVEFAADASIQLVQIGADLAATYGGTTKEAVDAFAAALRGEADPAERFNLNLKVSEVNAKAVELGLAATTREVDEAAKAQALLALVLEQSADAQGQFARESDTAAGAAQRAQAAWENAQAQLGQTLLPLLSGLANVVSTVAGGFGELPGPVQAVVGGITLLSAGLLVLAPRIVAAKSALDALGISARRFALVGGGTVGTITALVTVLQLFRQETVASQTDLTGLTEDLDRFERTGRITGEMLELFGEGAERFHEILERADSTVGRANDGFSRLVESIGLGHTETINARESIQALDQALAELVEQGADGDAILQKLAATYDLNEDQLATLVSLLPKFTDAQERAAERTRDAEEAQHGAMQADLARVESLQKVHDELRAQIDPAFALIRALEDQRAAQEAATEAEQQHGRNSPEYQKALRDEARAALEVLEAAGKLGDEFTGDLSDAQRQMLEDAGLSAAAIDQLERDLRQAKEQADRLDGTRIRIEQTIRTKYEIVGQPPTIPRAGGQVELLAHGGVVGAAQAGGPRSGPILVNEEGPELARLPRGDVVELPTGTTVIPAGQSEAIRSQIAHGGPGVTMNFYIQGSLLTERDLVMIIHEELLNGGLRDALAAALEEARQ